MPITDHTTTKQILLISSAENAENRATNDAFVASLNERLAPKGVSTLWRNYHGIGLELSAGELKAFIIDTNQSVHDFAAVYFKSYFRYHEQATAIVETLNANKTPFVGAELQEYIPAHKLSQMARLARAGIAIPKTIYLPTEHYVSQFDYVQSSLSERFVFKAIDGSTGDDNYLVSSQAQLAKIVAENADRHFIAQEFIANDSDLRFLVVGKQLKLIIKRSRLDDSTHLNNTSQGARAELIDVASYDPAIVKLALESADIMKRDIAGVDIMLQTDTGKPYVLEVNASPQIASGAFEQEKLAIYADYFAELV